MSRYRSFEDFEREEIFSRTSVDDVLSDDMTGLMELDFSEGTKRSQRAADDDE